MNVLHAVESALASLSLLAIGAVFWLDRQPGWIRRAIHKLWIFRDIAGREQKVRYLYLLVAVVAIMAAYALMTMTAWRAEKSGWIGPDLGEGLSLVAAGLFMGLVTLVVADGCRQFGARLTWAPVYGLGVWSAGNLLLSFWQLLRWDIGGGLVLVAVVCSLVACGMAAYSFGVATGKLEVVLLQGGFLLAAVAGLSMAVGVIILKLFGVSIVATIWTGALSGLSALATFGAPVLLHGWLESRETRRSGALR